MPTASRIRGGRKKRSTNSPRREAAASFCSTARPSRVLYFFQQLLPAFPGAVACFGIGWFCPGRFPRSHEPMARALIDYRFIHFVRLLHFFSGRGDNGCDAIVVASIKAMDLAVNIPEFLRLGGWYIEHKSRFQIRVLGGIGKGFSS